MLEQSLQCARLCCAMDTKKFSFGGIRALTGVPRSLALRSAAPAASHCAARLLCTAAKDEALVLADLVKTEEVVVSDGVEVMTTGGPLLLKAARTSWS